MSLFDRIQQEMKEAMKSRDSLKTNTLRGVIASVKTYLASSEETRGAEVTDELLIDLIAKEAKKREESIEAYEKAGRDDLVASESAELEILKRFLPEEMTVDEIRKLALKTIDDLKANNPSDLGKVMRELMARLKGRADGKLANRIVRELLESR
ncbi:glutamyl-tRNA amidotransferase [Mesotoga sp. SC_NapDC2]|uniref:GatB/YqeY domain-containing protein n=1 Tax=unclassified Mesotoga TaxID=1184398 RepID=UPI000A52E65C|nr:MULTISPECIES: GatB/YqeY domain-containing protein [unclassified Mesotoga]PNQ05391.1 glutamyl-tRNA amidotransferase [Mesotoga sp. SC_NapDC3]PXF35706.1 glutamyl-tRNA amidotransferase [Mesotoga sp. SC_NapDC]RAM65767.1 glutamyl-tRNA amidotransferase [Mesotoga sp. SC_3PWM13N19]RIZ61856.1 glutamyl-tRNA amidotransferase [Mesotoga sp. SC_NapDC2]MDD3459685.1 GatB/YqeY domain-containing protein [Mesotoga sp.]